MDPHPKLSLGSPAQHRLRALQKLGMIGDVVARPRAGEIDRTFGCQQAWIERWNDAARFAVQRQQPSAAQAVEALLKGLSSDSVIDDVHALTAGDAPHLGGEI